MKIGILTLPLLDNYGGFLQAIALYRFLNKNGYDVTLINKRYYNDDSILEKTIKNILTKIPFHDIKNLKYHKKRSQMKEKHKIFHWPIIEKEIFKISKNLYTKKDLEAFISSENLEAIIVGSDQVWRKEYINDKFYKSYFLDFIPNKKVKKIAYAASFGKDKWEGNNDINDISKLLKDFHAISTREESGIKICANTFQVSNVINVLDPTLLQDKDFYINFISRYDVSNIRKSEITTYVLDEAIEKKLIIEYLQKSMIAEYTNHIKGFNKDKLYTLAEWIASFANSKFIITDSFHGMVFSIIFEKDFLVIGNKKRGLDRFTSLLNLIGLEDRLIFSINNIKNKKLAHIDYKHVNKILNKEKEISYKFLIGSLNE